MEYGKKSEKYKRRRGAMLVHSSHKKKGMSNMLRRGQLVMVNFDERPGSCQRGIRPAVVIQNNMGNRHSTTTSVIPITSKSKRDLPVHIKLNNDYDLAMKGNIIMAEQLTVVDKSQIIDYGETLRIEDIREIEQAMLIQFSLMKYTA